MRQDPILSVRHIDKNFFGTQALSNVSFDLYAGEVHCLVGENGAGKSTLIKILSGAQPPDRGEIVIFGRKYTHLTPKQSIQLGIATIYQDVDLVGSLTVADNIFLGGERSSALGFVQPRQQEAASRDLMARLNIHIDPKALVEELSPAQKQTLQILKALHRDARILIMDEPTSSLGQEETRALMELVRGLTARGIAVIYISHYLEEILTIGDRITVLKNGEHVLTQPRAGIAITDVIRAMVGREASLFYEKERVPIGDVMLEVRGYTRKNVVKNVSFEVRRGEIFGIGGMVGSGRTELLNLLFGVDKRDAGTLILNGAEITPNNPREAIERGLSLIVEDRAELGLLLSRPVRENIALARNEQSAGVLNLRAEARMVQTMIDRLHIRLSGQGQEVGSLSGGNQQKSILGRWLLTDSQVFIFDEPTKGVDIGAREEIYRCMTDLVKQGHCIIMVSSDMPELLSMSDRIGVMRNGALEAIIDAAEATEEKLIRAFLGIADETH